MFRPAAANPWMLQPVSRTSRFHKSWDRKYQPFASHLTTPTNSSSYRLLVSTRPINSPLSLLLIHLNPRRARPPEHTTSTRLFRRCPTLFHASTRSLSGSAGAKVTQRMKTSFSRREKDLKLNTNLGENLDNKKYNKNGDKNTFKNVDAKPDRDLDDSWRTKIAPGTPYLEAYEILEEFADVLLLQEEEEATVPQRAFSGDDDERVPPDTSTPLPASLIPGPKSWPLVGCLPYMLRHPAFDPNRVYLFWHSLAQEFGPIFRKDMPGHPNMVFISNPEDVCAMFEATRLNPIRPGLTSLKKIRGEGRREWERERRESYRERERRESYREREKRENHRERERRDCPKETAREDGGKREREGGDEETGTRKREDEERRARGGEDGGRKMRGGEGCPRAVVFDGGAGILAEQGEEWWRVRRRVQKPITDLALVSRYLQDMDDVAKAFVRRIKSLRDEENEVPATFVNEIYKWAMESLATVVLERRLHCFEDDHRGAPESPHLIPLAKQFLDSLYETENVKLWQYFPTASITRLREAHVVFSEVALQAIEDAERAVASCRRGKEEPRRLSLLETLLATPGLSRGDVLTFLIDLLATGIDTTSHSVSHMLYLLAKNPEVQERVIREVDAEVGKAEHLAAEHIARLTYTRAVFREALRIMPVGIGITRRLNRDTVLGGYLVPKGWQVVAPSMLINHKDSIFPRASEFLPERFIRGSPLAPTHNYAFLPFSVGTRMCIGRRIAQQEIMCFITRVFGAFTVDYKHEDIHLVNKLNYRPSHPLRLTFHDRG